jgi:hypothetical protein
MSPPPLRYIFNNVESIRLYRDILRASRLFTWKTPQGEQWSKVLVQNARKEFEQAKHENDPEIIARLLVVGRDCLNQVRDQYMAQAKKIEDNIDKSRTDRR